MDEKALGRFALALSLLSERSTLQDVGAVIEALDAVLEGPSAAGGAERAALEEVHRALWEMLGGARTYTAEVLAGLTARVEDLRQGGAPEAGLACPPDVPAKWEGAAPQSYHPEDRAILEEFLQEARGHLDVAEAELLRLEQEPGEEGIHALFRAFHSLKGSAGFLGLKAVNTVCHAAESLLDGVRRKEYGLDRQGVEVLLGAVDHLRGQLDALAAGLGDPAEAGEDGRVPFAAPPTQALVQALESLQAALRGAPAERKRLGDILLEMKALDEDTLQQALAAQRTGEAPPPSGPAGVPEAVKVSVEKLDALVNLVGELVISHTIVAGSLGASAQDEVLVRELARLGKTVRDLQRQAMAMRMVPVRQSFQKATRLVRDLARAQGKLVSLELSGEETELDKTVIEEVHDPLVHLLRNALDHGIEPPAEREAAGKPATARLRLDAFHRGDNIVLRVEDDGRGLNRDRIREKAVRQGLLDAGAAPSDEELWDLIFQPGFSTAETVTDVSGRGVGMDVVRKNIHRLRGRVQVQTAPGRGTSFEIQLPLTLAIIDGMVVRVADQRFIVPTLVIREFIQPRRSQLYSVHERGEVLDVRGTVLPLARLGDFCAAAAPASAEQALVVVVENGDRACGLLVDELVGQQQVVVKSLGERLKHVEGVSGGAILGDGTVGLILDVPGVLNRIHQA